MKYLTSFSLLIPVVVASLIVLPLMAGQEAPSVVPNDDYRQLIETWRAKRHKSLTRPDGYLTQVGLEWLKDGENRIGRAADNDIRLTGGPANWGSVFLQDGQLQFIRSAETDVTINGEPLNESRLVPDSEGEPTIVASGTVSFYVISRGSFALRIKDSQAQGRLEFEGVESFPIDETWRINGRFVRAAKGTSIEIVNVLGQVDQSPVYGTFEFERDGKTHSLLGLGTEDSRDLWFIFADRTSGHGTYGAGRFLYSDGLPENDRLTEAYNPPCAFNAYSTCPLPPQRNRLDLFVTAGEKDFHPDSG
jgi:uncharacterized protein (DUF1684 family)